MKKPIYPIYNPVVRKQIAREDMFKHPSTLSSEELPTLRHFTEFFDHSNMLCIGYGIYKSKKYMGAL